MYASLGQARKADYLWTFEYVSFLLPDIDSFITTFQIDYVLFCFEAKR